MLWEQIIFVLKWKTAISLLTCQKRAEYAALSALQYCYLFKSEKYNNKYCNIIKINTSSRARRCQWNLFLKIILNFFIVKPITPPRYPWVSTKNVSPFGPAGRLAGYREHMYKCLVLFYNWFVRLWKEINYEYCLLITHSSTNINLYIVNCSFVLNIFL